MHSQTCKNEFTRMTAMTIFEHFKFHVEPAEILYQSDSFMIILLRSSNTWGTFYIKPKRTYSNITLIIEM